MMARKGVILSVAGTHTGTGQCYVKTNVQLGVTRMASAGQHQHHFAAHMAWLPCHEVSTTGQ